MCPRRTDVSGKLLKLLFCGGIVLSISGLSRCPGIPAAAAMRASVDQMNNQPECIPCCLRRLLHTADRKTSDDWLHRKILADGMQDLAKVDEVATPAELMHGVARRTAKALGVSDPYDDEKERWIAETTTNADWIRSVVDDKPDPFLAALHLSIAANILDCELRQDFAKGFSLKKLVSGFEKVPLALDHVEDFRQAVESAEKILFVHDAAGELFFDRLLIEKMEKPKAAVLSTLREIPVLADATRAEAEAVGLGEVAELIDVGIDCLGVPLNACSQEFREQYQSSDLVIAKGQAAYQTLEGDDLRNEGKAKSIFFLLRVKCAVTARVLGVSLGDGVLEPG